MVPIDNCLYHFGASHSAARVESPEPPDSEASVAAACDEPSADDLEAVDCIGMQSEDLGMCRVSWLEREHLAGKGEA